ncbi:hypothetical protein QQF64_002352 [Cirrhinus molitorella]|uniref:Uncharacterized protein n=1 Tax=Cirrhinus molitorella TaxID=172907 RepID=A0ABR3MPZ0_9TELE
MGVGLQPQREAIWVHITASPPRFLPPSNQKGDEPHVLTKTSAMRGESGRMHVEFKDSSNKAIRHGVLSQLKGFGRHNGYTAA